MMTPQHEERVRRLLASWRLRVTASNDQQQGLLIENIAAVDAALVLASKTAILEERISVAITELCDICDKQTDPEKFVIDNIIRTLKGDT